MKWFYDMTGAEGVYVRWDEVSQIESVFVPGGGIKHTLVAGMDVAMLNKLIADGRWLELSGEPDLSEWMQFL